MTLARTIRQNKLPSVPHLAQNGRGLREMREDDVPAVKDLFTQYISRFGMWPVMTAEEIQHQFLSGMGTGETNDMGRREGQVVWTYVVENSQTHEITDFFSFYSLPSTIINHEKHKLLEAAFLFYYATDVAWRQSSEEGALKKRLTELVHDALIVAEQKKFDVFNALTLMDNDEFLPDLKACFFGDQSIHMLIKPRLHIVRSW
jgi:glycylpeptide N-tetradecanoyltransferase